MNKVTSLVFQMITRIDTFRWIMKYIPAIGQGTAWTRAFLLHYLKDDNTHAVGQVPYLIRFNKSGIQTFNNELGVWGCSQNQAERYVRRRMMVLLGTVLTWKLYVTIWLEMWRLINLNFVIRYYSLAQLKPPPLRYQLNTYENNIYRGI